MDLSDGIDEVRISYKWAYCFKGTSENDETDGQIYIATDGKPHSSREIYNSICSSLDKSIPKWSVPKFLFDMASLASPRIKYKLNKLLGKSRLNTLYYGILSK